MTVKGRPNGVRFEIHHKFNNTYGGRVLRNPFFLFLSFFMIVDKYI